MTSSLETVSAVTKNRAGNNSCNRYRNKYGNNSVVRLGLALIMLVSLPTCQWLMPSFEKPTVSLKSFRVVPSRSLSLNPEFVIDLRIANPNSIPLSLKGISYEASIEGHRIITGVANDLPVVEPYGEADITLGASADMLGGFRLIQDLILVRRDALNYSLRLKIDPGSLIPPVYLTEEGAIRLTPESVY